MLFTATVLAFTARGASAGASVTDFAFDLAFVGAVEFNCESLFGHVVALLQAILNMADLLVRHLHLL